MKTLVTIWLTAIATFAFVDIYLISTQERINAPGELGEVLGSIGMMIFLILFTTTGLIMIGHYFNKYRKEK